MFTEFTISITVFLVSFIAFYSGFGLGTSLMPVIAIFFPISFAIAITALIHLLHNCLKLVLLWSGVRWFTVFLFGIPAIFSAFAGAWALVAFSGFTVQYSYTIFGTIATITLVKVVVGILLLFFAIIENFPQFKKIFLFTQSLPIGGILSGFFGGLSGHQGAFRSAYLMQLKLNKNEFIATSAAISTLVDIARLIVYGINIHTLATVQVSASLIVSIIFSSFIGTLFGRYALKKVTIRFIHNLITVMLYVFGVALILGLI